MINNITKKVFFYQSKVGKSMKSKLFFNLPIDFSKAYVQFCVYDITLIFYIQL